MVTFSPLTYLDLHLYTVQIIAIITYKIINKITYVFILEVTPYKSNKWKTCPNIGGRNKTICHVTLYLRQINSDNVCSNTGGL